MHKIQREPKESRPYICATFSELHPSAANMSRPRSAPTVLASGKLGACVTLPSIALDTCLRLKILRRHSIGNKERQAEQSSCLCRCTRTKINYFWNVLVSRLAAMIGVSTASVNAAGFLECYAEIEPQHVAAGQSVACGEFASGDFTSGHPPSPRTV